MEEIKVLNLLTLWELGQITWGELYLQVEYILLEREFESAVIQ